MSDVRTAGPDGRRETLPATQHASVLHAIGDVRLEERAVPEPGPCEVLIRVAAVGVCGSDVHYDEHGRIADFVVESPLVLGHEASGTVVAAGSQVTRVRPGDRVAMEPGVPCGHCRQCRAGRYNLCPDVRFFATPPIDGAFAEYVVLDEAFAHPVPDTLSDEAAALIEPLSVAVWANRKARVEPGMSVLVSGAGPIGLLCLQVARARGAARVVATDVSEHRLAVARRLGAETVNVREREASSVIPDADVLLECSGSAEAIAGGVRCVAPAGTVVLVGMGEPTLPLPVDVIQQNELWVTGTFRYAHVYPAAIELAASGAVELDGLVTARFGLADAERALMASRRDPAALKVIVRPDGRTMG